MSKADDLGLGQGEASTLEAPTTSAARALQRAFNSLDVKLHASLKFLETFGATGRPSHPAQHTGAPSPESCEAVSVEQVGVGVKQECHGLFVDVHQPARRWVPGLRLEWKKRLS